MDGKPSVEQALNELEEALRELKRLALLIRVVSCPCYVPDVGTRQELWKNKN